MERIASIDMTSERVELFYKLYPSNHYGVDKQSRLIFIEKVGCYNYKDLAKYFTLSDMEDQMLQYNDRLLFVGFPVLSKLYGKRISEILLIMDFKRFKILDFKKKKVRQIIGFAIKFFQDCYPGFSGKQLLSMRL